MYPTKKKLPRFQRLIFLDYFLDHISVLNFERHKDFFNKQHHFLSTIFHISGSKDVCYTITKMLAMKMSGKLNERI